jgi:hypothetical protein
VSHLLSEEEEKDLVSMCQPLQGRLGRDSEFCLKIVTGDEMWVYKYDPETKQQSSQWNSPIVSTLRNAREVCSDMKNVHIVSFETYRVMHHEFVPNGQTVSQHDYVDCCGEVCGGVYLKSGIRGLISP